MSAKTKLKSSSYKMPLETESIRKSMTKWVLEDNHFGRPAYMQGGTDREHQKDTAPRRVLSIKEAKKFPSTRAAREFRKKWDLAKYQVEPVKVIYYQKQPKKRVTNKLSFFYEMFEEQAGIEASIDNLVFTIFQDIFYPDRNYVKTMASFKKHLKIAANNKGHRIEVVKTGKDPIMRTNKWILRYG